MKKLILLSLSCLAAVSICLPQRTNTRNDVNNSVRQADQLHHDMIKAELETHRVVLTYQRNTQGNFDFTCENKGFCNYIVDVTFPEFENLQADISVPVHITVQPGVRRVFTLRKITNGVPTRMSYRYHTFKGSTNPKVDSNFIYLLPVAPGKETRIYELNYIAKEYGGESEPKDYYVLSLHMHSGDTIFAARSGRVNETRDVAEATADSGLISYSRGATYVEIAHNDGSFAKYSIFRDSAIFVHPGDWLEAGQPLGIAGGEKYTGGPQVRFSVYYNFDQVITKDGQSTDRIQHWAYVPLRFWTKGQGSIHLTNKIAYTSDHPVDVITQEMSKKEAKKWMASHNKSS